MTNTHSNTLTVRPLVIAAMFAALASLAAVPSRALELVPSIGVTKSTDKNAGDANGFGGLALRVPLTPFLKAEAGIGYRQDSFAGGDLKVRQWPISASLWVSPFPVGYVGGGVGWYRTTLDWNSRLPIDDSTSQKLGVHLGGGATFPITPKLGLDLNGRYIFMKQDDGTLQVPTTFNPNFWNVAAGLAIKF